jgi:hypothetical protein
MIEIPRTLRSHVSLLYSGSSFASRSYQRAHRSYGTGLIVGLFQALRARLPSFSPFGTNGSAADRIGLALVLQSFSDGGSEASLHGWRPPHADTPKRRYAQPLPNQPPELLFIHNPDIKRARFLQLAAGLLSRQQKIRFTADAGGQPAAMAPNQIRKHVSWLA